MRQQNKTKLHISTEPKRKVRLCLDPVRLNQELIKLVHRRPTLNDIFFKTKQIYLIDMRPGYNNLKLDDGS